MALCILTGRRGEPTAQARLVEAISGLRKRDTPDLRGEFRRAYADLPAYRRKYVFGSRMEKYQDLQRLLEGEAPDAEPGTAADGGGG